MKRGEIWTAVFPGNYGNPSPGLVVQSDCVDESLASVVLCPLTSELTDDEFRITVEPTSTTGLRKRSQIMIDKIAALPKTKVRERIGKLEDSQLAAVHEALLFVIGAMDAPNAN